MPVVQHDAFRPLVAEIMRQCSDLHRFHLGSEAPPFLKPGGDDHLLMRARERYDCFRAIQTQRPIPAVVDGKYVARDRTNPTSTKNAYEAAFLVKQWSLRIAVSRDIAGLLQEWSLIQGYIHDFDPYLFTDLIDLEIALHWGSLFKLCHGASEAHDKFKLMFLFATMSFNQKTDMAVIRSFIAISVFEGSKISQTLPQCPRFIRFRRDQVPTRDSLVQLMKPYRHPYPEDERAGLPIALHYKQRHKLEMLQIKHEQLSEQSCKAIADHLLSQWPSREQSTADLGGLPLLDCGLVFSAIEPEWQRLVDNYELSQHLKSVQELLNTCIATEDSTMLSSSEGEQEFFPMTGVSSIRTTMQDLLRKLLMHAIIPKRKLSTVDCLRRTASEVEPDCRNSMHEGAVTRSLVLTHQYPSSQYQNDTRPQAGLSGLISELRIIVRSFALSADPTRQLYGSDLNSSVRSLVEFQRSKSEDVAGASLQTDLAALDTSIPLSRYTLHEQLASIRISSREVEKWLELGAMLPDVTPVTLLEMLRPGALPKDLDVVRDIIIEYGESIVGLQQMLRIRSALQREDEIQLASELHHGRATWRAKDHIDWLLLEIDFNLSIRPDQLEVAEAMTSPLNRNNFVLQMNMGQGKSSVIVPMVVSELANAKNLVRVVVPRPLLQQTAQLLQDRLGGLIGRKLRHVPFSRKSSTKIVDMRMYFNLHVEILKSRGVMLTLPEHILSFKLSGLQELSNGHIQQATSMLNVQAWFTRRCRDLPDECDHMLAVKTQLIYPSGAQSTVDGHPYRWKVVQSLLKLVKTHLILLRSDFSRSIEYVPRAPGTFPTIYLLNSDVKDALIRRLTDSVLRGEGGIIPVDSCSQDELESISSFLREAHFPKTSAEKISRVFKSKIDARQQLLLLRGLIIHSILLLGLAKRWNVQYG